MTRLQIRELKKTKFNLQNHFRNTEMISELKDRIFYEIPDL